MWLANAYESVGNQEDGKSTFKQKFYKPDLSIVNSFDKIPTEYHGPICWCYPQLAPNPQTKNNM